MSRPRAGANGLVRGLSSELGEYGIRVNALCPFHGMSANFPGGADDDPLEKSYEEMAGEWDKSAAPMPLKIDRAPNMRDAANLALFLASGRVGVHVRSLHPRHRRGGTHARVALNLG